MAAMHCCALESSADPLDSLIIPGFNLDMGHVSLQASDVRLPVLTISGIILLWQGTYHVPPILAGNCILLVCASDLQRQFVFTYFLVSNRYAQLLHADNSYIPR